MNIQTFLDRYANGQRDFAGIQFREGDLSNLNLKGINLSKANLEGANLSGTNLQEASLERLFCLTQILKGLI
ncbi:pentapeptide repeat-containing protein [Kovacikia minuta]|uniref:pentapeptide repeat-containing protein n=1 Tax=Kovacikia minuta TaxID=2931930 RepID=UPI0020C7FF45|nr:pentapeptide repeat-containing protein [Kovacikia minuta]